MENKSLGQIAFEAYCKAKENKTYDNKPIPKWDDLPLDVRYAWLMSVDAILQRVHFVNDETIY